MNERPLWADALTNVLSGMAGQPPKRLLRAVAAFSDQDITEDELVTFLKSVSVNDRAMIQMRISLGGWDAMSLKEMGGHAEPNTENRRLDVYRRLGLGKEAMSVLEARAPAVVEKTTVISRVFDPWYYQSRHQRPTMYWDHYAGLLRDVKEWPSEAISSLDLTTTRVVERLSDPRRLEAKQTKGLVVGYVQSGKTANFTGVIAKAVDAGYRLVIVLTGTIELLRAQTQRRLDMELVGQENLLQGLDPEDPKFLKEFDYTNDTDWVEEKFIQHGPALDQPGVPRIRRVTTRGSDYRRLPQGLSRLRFDLHDRSKQLNHPDNLAHSDAHIAVIKKNAASLQNLIDDLRPIRKDLADLPVLIIDDESDQASPNTKDPKKSTKEQRDRTRINKLISELLSMCSRAQYVGYTATPFANVFIDPDDERDLFPSDFLLSLQRPPEYMGVSDFHDVGARWDDETKSVANSNELAYVRGLTGAPQDDPDRREAELREALDAFVLSGAIKAYREVMGGGRQRHHTMLVHESVRTAEQLEAAAVVRSLWHTGEYGSSGLERLAKLYSTDFGPVMNVRANGQPVPKSFSELKPFIGIALSRIMRDQDPVLVINSDSEIQRQQKKLDFDADSVWRILVGGSKLSRGFTVEGLTISYFRRKALQADTLMQAGRWFGFRPGYRDLVRLYIRRDAQVDLYHAFEALLLDEESFREELRRYEGLDEHGRPLVEPRHVPPMVSQHLPWLRPTARNKMWNAVLESKAPAGRLLDFFGHPARNQRDAKRHNFVEVTMPLLTATTPECVSLPYQLSDLRGAGTFQSRLGSISAQKMVQLLKQMRWHPAYAGSFRPVLRFIEEATQAGRIDDWTVVWPQPSRPWLTATVGGIGDIPLTKRSRRREPRIDFVGSDAKHRQGAEMIARGDGVSGLSSSSTRGVLLITVAPDVEDVTSSEALTHGDLVGLFSLAVPATATPNRRDLVRWTVRSSERPDDPTVEVTDRARQNVPF